MFFRVRKHANPRAARGGCMRDASVIRISLLSCAMLLATGCAKNWHESHKEFSDPFERGQYDQASAAAVSIAKEGADTDKVLLNMEAGAILRTAGKIQESNAAFDEADSRIGDYNNWPTVKISEEIG